MKFFKNYFLLAAIIAIAIAVRLYNLSSVPIGFNDDEAAFGYNAYSILKTGRDEWGKLLPFPAFESFGDWKLVGYLYPVVFSQLIFGETIFATRLPSVLFGVGAIAVTYFLGKKLFDPKIGLLSSFLLAINPWHIIASRNAFESDVLILFLTSAIYFLVVSLENSKYLKYAGIIFGLSLYVYRSSWVFVPIFLIIFFYFHRAYVSKIKKDFFSFLLIFFIFSLPLIPALITFKGQSRFIQESFISSIQRSGIINEINEKRGSCLKETSEIYCKFLYSKYLSFITIYFNNYFNNLSPQTLFTKGPAAGYQSFSDRGLLYSLELPLLAIGLALIFKNKNHSNKAKILIPWLLIAPIGASFTGVGNPGRLNIILPSLQIIESFAFFSILLSIKNSFFKISTFGLVSIIILISFSRLMSDMFFNYPMISGKSQRYGYKELFDFLHQNESKYSQIAVSRRNDDAKQYIHYLFNEKIDPMIFLDQKITARYRGDDKWQVVERIGNIYFFPSTPKLESLPAHSLLAGGEKEISHGKPVFIVNYPNGDRAFEVYDVDSLKESIRVKDKQREI